MSRPSKRESSSSKPGELLPRNLPPFYLDETNDSNVLVEALRAYGFKVKRHSEYFSKGTEDEQWLPVVGRKGWLILSRDSQWKYNDVEKAALAHEKARAFIISEGKNKMSDEAIAEAVFKAKNVISKLVKNTPPPFTAKIYRDGSVRKE